jgi:hypothetical protein
MIPKRAQAGGVIYNRSSVPRYVTIVPKLFSNRFETESNLPGLLNAVANPVKTESSLIKLC